MYVPLKTNAFFQIMLSLFVERCAPAEFTKENADDEEI